MPSRSHVGVLDSGGGLGILSFSKARFTSEWERRRGHMSSLYNSRYSLPFWEAPGLSLGLWARG